MRFSACVLSAYNTFYISGTLVTCYFLSFGNIVVNPVHLLLSENIKGEIISTNGTYCNKL